MAYGQGGGSCHKTPLALGGGIAVLGGGANPIAKGRGKIAENGGPPIPPPRHGRHGQKLHSGFHPGSVDARSSADACLSQQKVQGREANRRRQRPTEPTPKALCQTPPGHWLVCGYDRIVSCHATSVRLVQESPLPGRRCGGLKKRYRERSPERQQSRGGRWGKAGAAGQSASVLCDSALSKPPESEPGTGIRGGASPVPVAKAQGLSHISTSESPPLCQTGAAIGQMWNRHLRSGHACPTAFLA